MLVWKKCFRGRAVLSDLDFSYWLLSLTVWSLWTKFVFIYGFLSSLEQNCATCCISVTLASDCTYFYAIKNPFLFLERTIEVTFFFNPQLWHFNSCFVFPFGKGNFFNEFWVELVKNVKILTVVRISTEIANILENIMRNYAYIVKNLFGKLNRKYFFLVY